MDSYEIQEETRIARNFARIREARIENALYLIRSAFDRVRISLILPMLADNLDHMERMLKGTFFSPSVKLLSRLFQFKFSKDVYVDLEIIKIINFFHKNAVIYKFFPRYMNKLPEDDKKLLYACETLYKVAQRRLHRTASVEINLEKTLCDMYEKREELMEDVQRIKKRLRSRYIVLRWKNASKSVVLEARERDLAERKWKNSIFIQNEIKARERALNRSHKATVIRQKELQEELSLARDQYNKLLKTIANEEKSMRDEKNKLMIQLEMILHKFDTNMVEKNCECLVLEDKYKVAKRELDVFMVEYRKEEAVYKKIVVQYEMEERKKQQQRIAIFMMNRAARRIQQYWQKWRRDKRMRERRAGRKKKK